MVLVGVIKKGVTTIPQGSRAEDELRLEAHSLIFSMSDDIVYPTRN